jgi:hypothetical protein
VYGFDGIMEETSRNSCSKVARQAGSGRQNPEATAAYSSLPHEKSTTTSAQQNDSCTTFSESPYHCLLDMVDGWSSDEQDVVLFPGTWKL